MKEADYSMAKNSGTNNRGIFAGILGSLAALGIGIVIGLYAIDNCDDCPSNGFVPVDDRVSLQLRRTTFVVYNMTRSLQFYKDGLGMVPIYDKIIPTPSDAETIEESEIWRHLVFLRSNNEEIGVVGLLQYVKPGSGPQVELRDPSEYFKTGDTVLVFTSSEPVGDKLDRVLEVENTMVQEAPHVVQYPAYDGKSLITVNLTTVVDPDGHLVEINHIMDGLDLNSN